MSKFKSIVNSSNSHANSSDSENSLDNEMKFSDEESSDEELQLPSNQSSIAESRDGSTAPLNLRKVPIITIRNRGALARVEDTIVGKKTKRIAYPLELPISLDAMNIDAKSATSQISTTTTPDTSAEIRTDHNSKRSKAISVLTDPFSNLVPTDKTGR
ncbi:MAG: hypothetical protein V4694_07350 [Pseudomonadota bacterium]